MEPNDLMPPDDRDLSEPQARQEYEGWLDEQEREKLKDLDKHMNLMWKEFENIFGDSK